MTKYKAAIKERETEKEALTREFTANSLGALNLELEKWQESHYNVNH